jgi:uncharacterized protein
MSLGLGVLPGLEWRDIESTQFLDPMAKDLIRYDLLVQDALKSVVRKVLSDAARDGLPGEHHFYVTFRTTLPGVRMSQALRDQYPEEMTIVLQHQFWDLAISDHSIEVGLSFKGIPERLLIPFDTVTCFFDPSVQFGLKFELEGEGAGEAKTDEEGAAPRPRPRAVTSADVPAETPAAKPKPARKPASKDKPSVVEKVPSAGKPSGGKGEGTSAASKSGASAEVVSLDAFRKKT